MGVQSAQFAAILTELQQLTIQLEEERATTQARIDEAVAESRHALRASEVRTAELEVCLEEAEQQTAAKEEQRPPGRGAR